MASGSLKSIKKRISSVKSTQKITKAMKMVAAAKLRRAEHAAFAARSYVDALGGMTKRIVMRSGPASHPLFQTKTLVKKRELFVISSDRGLCGGFNGTLLRRTGLVLAEWRKENVVTDCRVIGRRGRDFFNSKRLPTKEILTGLFERIERAQTLRLVEPAVARFLKGETDEVWMIHNWFRSVLSQEVKLERLLPLPPTIAGGTPAGGTPSLEGRGKGEGVDYIYEPSRTAVLDRLCKEAVVARVHQAFLESYAAELAARMTAMDSATKNASEMIGYLTLQYNRARQAAITRELMDIVNGAEALR